MAALRQVLHSLTDSVPYSCARTRPILGIEYTLVVVYRHRGFGRTLAGGIASQKGGDPSSPASDREELTFQRLPIDRAKDPGKETIGKTEETGGIIQQSFGLSSS